MSRKCLIFIMSVLMLLCNEVIASNILYVATNETGAPADGNVIGDGAMSQLYSLANTNTVNCGAPDITVVGNPDTVTCFSSVLSDTALTRPDFYSVDATGKPYDIIIVLSTYGIISDAHWAAITQSSIDNPAVPIILFRDACGNCSSFNGPAGGSGDDVVTQIADLLKVLNPNSPITPSTVNNSNTPAYVNPNSVFFGTGDFTGTIASANFRDLLNVPRDNIVYYTNSAAVTSSLDFDDAFSVILPESQSLGSCLLATVDTSFFSPLSPLGYSPDVMKDFIGAAKQTGSACGAISPLHLTEKVTNDNGNLTSVEGDILTYTIMLTNTSATSSYSSEFIYNAVPKGTTYVAGSITSSDTAILPTDDSNTSNLVWGNSTNLILPNASFTLSFKAKVAAITGNQGGLVTQASDYYNNFSSDVTGVLGSKGPKGQTMIVVLNPLAPIPIPNTLEAAKPIPSSNIYSLLSLVVLVAGSYLFVVFIAYNNRKK